MKSIVLHTIAVFFLLMMITLPAFGDDLSDLLDEVEKVGISWEGFHRRYAEKRRLMEEHRISAQIRLHMV